MGKIVKILVIIFGENIEKVLVVGVDYVGVEEYIN